MTAKTPVAFVIGQLSVGGGERQLALLLERLDRSRFDPAVITFHPDQGDYWEGPIRELGVPILGVPPRPLRLLRLLDLTRKLRRLGAAAVVSWSLHLNAYVAIAGRLAGARLRVASIRSDLFNPMKPDRPRHRRLGTKGADVFVANSTRGRDDLVERLGIDPGRVLVVFNAVEPPPDAEGDRAAGREALGLPGGAFLAVNVGRLEPSKNQRMLLRVLARVAVEAPDLHVVMLGEGPDRPALESEAGRLGLSGRVHLPGIVPHAGRRFGLFDLLVHTGRAEGMPNVLLEAASAGLPVVSTRVNGAADILEDGKSGRLVAMEDDAAFAEALLELYRDADLRRRYGAEAAARIRSGPFAPERMVEAFEALLGRVA